MLFAALSYIYFTYWLVFRDGFEGERKKELMVWVGTILFFVGACSWAPFLYYYFKKGLSKIFVYLSLSVTSVGIMLLMIYLMNEGDILSRVCVGVFLFHVLVMDNIIWSVKFQGIKNNSIR